MKYQVIVGNIGIVCDTDDLADAIDKYEDYVLYSGHCFGRASGEPVTLFEDGEIIREHEGE